VADAIEQRRPFGASSPILDLGPERKASRQRRPHLSALAIMGLRLRGDDGDLER